jgi:hypothetical protein
VNVNLKVGAVPERTAKVPGLICTRVPSVVTFTLTDEPGTTLADLGAVTVAHSGTAPRKRKTIRA